LKTKDVKYLILTYYENIHYFILEIYGKDLNIEGNLSSICEEILDIL
jgi:hypothetical protein